VRRSARRDATGISPPPQPAPVPGPAAPLAPSAPTEAAPPAPESEAVADVETTRTIDSRLDPTPLRDPDAVANGLSLLEAAERVSSLRSEFASTSWATVAWGLYAIFFGYGGLAVSQLNIVLVAIGIGLVIEGVWLRFQRAPAALRVDGRMMALLATWNILVTLANLAAPAAQTEPDISSPLDRLPPVVWLGIGVWQASIAWRRFRLATRLERERWDNPSPAAVHDARALIEQEAAAVRELPSVSGLNAVEAAVDRGRLRLIPVGEFVMAVHPDGLWSGARADSFSVETVNSRPAADGYVRISLGGKTISATMRQDQLERCRNWNQDIGLIAPIQGFTLVNSVADLKRLYRAGKVLLFADRALVAANGLARFRSEVLPAVEDIAAANGVKLAWANLSGSSPDLERQLDGQMGFRGCVLYGQGGWIVDSRSIDNSTAIAAQFVQIARELLDRPSANRRPRPASPAPS
jgi:hypothetical protein